MMMCTLSINSPPFSQEYGSGATIALSSESFCPVIFAMIAANPASSFFRSAVFLEFFFVHHDGEFVVIGDEYSLVRGYAQS